MSQFSVSVEFIKNSQLARQDNYMGKGYGYDKAGMDAAFVGVTDKDTKIFTPPTSPGKLPANGTQYAIPTSLGGGVGTFNASDYTIRNSAGQIVGSINWSPTQPDAVGTGVIGSPRWAVDQMDVKAIYHDIEIGIATDHKSRSEWLAANDRLLTAALVTLVSIASSPAEKLDALAVVAAITSGFMNPPSDWPNAPASTAGIPMLSDNASSKPQSFAVSADGKTVTLVYVSNGATITQIDNYTDSTRKILSTSSVSQKDATTGQLTKSTINFNPEVANGSCTYTSETTSADGKTLIQKVDSNADGKIDSVTTTTTTSNGNQIVQVDSKNSGVIDQTYVLKNGQRYNTANLNDALYIDGLRNNNQLGAISGALAQQMDRAISNTLTSPTSYVGPSYSNWSQGSSVTVEPYYGSLSSAPIGAFYEAKSAALDKALSIADKTGVLISANNKGTSAAALQSFDTNHDGKLSGSELAGLQVWTDTNENGALDAGELKSLAAAGINQVAGTDYSFYTKGNSVWANSPASTQSTAPTQTNLVQGVPASNYRTLRDTDNRYMVNSSQWIDFGANQVKINNSNRTYLIGTDGNDNFDANYYAAYAQYINSNLLTNFEAGAGDDVMGGSSRNDNLWGGTGNDTLFGYAGDDKLYGEEGNDQLQGGAGNDYLDGGVGNDALFGQVGNDTLVGGDGDDILLGFTASNEAKQTLLAGETDNDYLYGGNGNDQLYGGLGNDYLDGGAGNDLLMGGDDQDILFGGAGDDELNGGTGNDQLSGDAGNDKMFGGVGNDTMWGGDGNDIMMGFTPTNDAQQTLLAGQADNDVMYGGAGDDLMLGGLGDDQLWGGIGADELQGGVGNDMLYGEDGNDRLFGGAGNDTIYGGAGDDLIVGGVASNETALIAGTADSNFLYGGDGNDTILGGIGNDYIDGGAGADNMQGGLGDDTYIVNSVNDVILEFTNQGYDTVVSSSNYILNSNIEELRLVEGAGAINGTGNSLDNLITGNSSDNILDGVTGADTMIGGLGNDTYYVDNVGDKVIENANEGIDTVQSKISYTLGDNVENLNLLDFGKAEKGLVDGQAVLVYGYPKANELDYMQGDAVANYKGTCALTSIANLLTQAKTPTTEAQVVSLAIANSWAVTSSTATDYQRGGSNYAQQQAILSSYGTDNALISGYNEQGVANLIRSGRGVIMAVNAGKLWNDAAYLDNGAVNHVVTITGAVYGETDGTLKGFYIADSGRSLVSDMTRYVGIADFRAAANVPSSYAIYTTAAGKLWDENINATGNSLDNTIIGNRGNNILNGMAGNDTLIGGAGNDTYAFGLGSGLDTVIDTDSTVGNVDTISVAAGVVKEQLWFAQSGNDLVMSIIGTGDKDIIKDWYVGGTSGSQNQIEQIKLSNGNTLANTQVNALVQAMAAYTPPAMGVTTLSTTYQASLAPVIAANWH